MGRATGFHHHQPHLAIDEPALELVACQAMGFQYLPMRIGHGQLEHALCQVNGDSSSIHVGLLSLMSADNPSHMSASWHDDAVQKREESIPSIERRR